MTKEQVDAFGAWKTPQIDKLRRQHQLLLEVTGSKIGWDQFCVDMFHLSQNIQTKPKAFEETVPYGAFPFIDKELGAYIRHCLIRLDFECPHQETKMKVWTLIVALMAEISAANERKL